MVTDHTTPKPQQALMHQADITQKTNDKALTPAFQQANYIFDRALCDLVKEFSVKQYQLLGDIMGDIPKGAAKSNCMISCTTVHHHLSCRLCTVLMYYSYHHNTMMLQCSHVNDNQNFLVYDVLQFYWFSPNVTWTGQKLTYVFG